jgi:hypothetical protein
MLALRRGPFPDTALAEAELAYGDDVMAKLRWVPQRLADTGERRQASEALGHGPITAGCGSARPRRGIRPNVIMLPRTR